MKINRANFSLLVVLLVSAASYAQTTAFSYQGRLSESGTPVTGTRHFRFTLFDEGGVAIPGATIEQSLEVTSGVFNTSLNFGAANFPAADRSLLIEVKVNLGDSYTVLSPRQQILSTPFSIKSKSADTATNATNAATATNTIQLGGVTADQYVTNTTLGTNAIRNQTTQQSSANFNISGSGTIGGNLILGSGTQSSPSLTFSSDTGTGLFRSGAGKLNFSTGGASRMLITADGKVGIGTANPFANFEVISPFQEAVRASTVAAGGTGVSGSGPATGVSGFSNGTDGVGVQGDASGSGGAGVGGRSTSATGFGGYFVNSNSSGKALVAGDSTGAEAFTVLASGYVGINNAAPLQRLDVIGNARASGDVIGGTRLCIAADCRSAWPSGIGGTGTTHRLSKFAGAATLGDSQISDDGTDVTIGVTGGGLRVLANATGPNIVGGFSGNTVTAGVVGGTIAGGGTTAGDANLVTDGFGTVGGGQNNQAGDNSGSTTDKLNATVGGGHSNTASGGNATVGGGYSNTANGSQATVGGGFVNTASGHNATVGGGTGNRASGDASTVAGGSVNTATGITAAVGGGSSNDATGNSATVPGGVSNTASGNYSFAAGRQAKATHQGAFVWADSVASDFISTGNNQFLIRAGGGVGINTNSPTGGGLKVAGLVESTDGGFKFPDGTIQTTAGGGGGGGIGGSGTAGFIPKFSASTALANSSIFEFGTNVGIGTIGPAHKLEVIGGNIRASGDVIGGTRLCIAADCRSAWPAGGGSGTVTSISVGTGLTSSPNPITTTGTISIDTSVVPRLTAVNNFTNINNFATGSFTSITNQAVVTVTNNATTGGYGVFGTTAANSGSLPAGVRGDATATTGSTYGVYGQSFSGSGTGVYGVAQDTGTGTTYGARGTSQSKNGVGVWGQAAPFDQSGNAIGVQGTTGSTAGSGISGAALNPSAGSAYGGYFTSVTPGGGGISGRSLASTGVNYGVYGEAVSPTGFGVYSQGNLHVAGNITYTGTISQISSRRWKTNIEPLTGALGKVQRLQGVSYDWKETGKRDIGLIAEEVRQIVPEVVGMEDDGVNAKGIDYARLSSLLIEAVKEQQAEIDRQRQEIDALRRLMCSIKKDAEICKSREK